MQSWTIGGYHLLETGDYQHGFNVTAMLAERSDAINPALGNTTRSLTIGLNEQFPTPLYANVQVNLLDVEGETLTQNLATLSGKVGYRFAAQGLNVALAAQNTNASFKAFTAGVTTPAFEQDSDRFTLTLNGGWQFRPDMDLEIRVGYNRYQEEQNPDNQYTERFLILRHRYVF